MPCSQLDTVLERNQLRTATRSMYSPVGSSDFGRMLKMYGSRLMSTPTGGGSLIRVWFSE